MECNSVGWSLLIIIILGILLPSGSTLKHNDGIKQHLELKNGSLQILKQLFGGMESTSVEELVEMSRLRKKRDQAEFKGVDYEDTGDDEVADEAPPEVNLPKKKVETNDTKPFVEEEPETTGRGKDGTKSKAHRLDLIHGRRKDETVAQITKGRLPPIMNSNKTEAAANESISDIETVAAAPGKKATALAKGVLNNVTANAVSKTGDDAVALATNGSSADAMAITMNGNGSAWSGASTHGDDGAKSAAFNQGDGTASSSALSKGQKGKAQSDAMAKASNATAVARGNAGGAEANAIVRENGTAFSTSAATDGGGAKSTSMAKGIGIAKGVAHTTGGGNASALTRANDGNSESDSLAKDTGSAYSASWAKETGDSVSNAKTFGGGGSRAEALADGLGLSTANAYQALNESTKDVELDLDALLDSFDLGNGQDLFNAPFFGVILVDGEKTSDEMDDEDRARTYRA